MRLINAVVALIGLPGAGKGTQAQLLAGSGWSHVNVGGLVRAEVAVGSDWGLNAAAVMRRGDLLPSQDIQALLSRQLSKLRPPLVIEGYPRRLSEAETMHGMIPYEAKLVYLWFEIPAAVAASRLAARLVCARCECVVRKGEQDVCPQCSGPLISREDDSSLEAVRRRLRNFETETFPLLEYYRSRGRLDVVDAMLEKAAVYAEIATKIASRCELSVRSHG